MKRILSVVMLGVFGAVIPGTAAGDLFSPGEIYVVNNTCEDLRIAVHFKERFTEGKWRTVCCWNFTPGERAYLESEDRRLRGEDDVIYVWAEGSDGWEFSGELSLDGRKFKRVVDGGYDYDIHLGRKFYAGDCPHHPVSTTIKSNREVQLKRERCYSRCRYEAEICKQNWKANCLGVEFACRDVCASANPWH